jgi:hypothetical protein
VRPIAVAVVLCAALAAPAGADDLPVGKFGAIGGVRQNTGSLGDAFGFGWLLGVEAGYQPSPITQSLSLGVSWEVMWGRFGADDPDLVEEELSVLEMNFGARVRRMLGSNQPRFLVVVGGVTLLRTSVPVPPDMDRLYLGPYAGIGLDQYLGGTYLLSLEARYGLITGGPSSMTLVASFSFGSR